MKYLTLVLAMVLCTSVSLFSQAIQVTSLAYDSSSYAGYDPVYHAQFTVLLNTEYSANIHFVWSNSPQEILDGANGSSHDLGSISFPASSNPWVLEHTLEFFLHPTAYLPLINADTDGIFFGYFINMVDTAGVLEQIFISSLYTWRFPPELSTSLEEKSSLVGYNMYPNPAIDQFQVEGFSGQILITDVLGKSVLSAQLMLGESLDVSTLTSGTYIVHADNTLIGKLQKL